MKRFGLALLISSMSLLAFACDSDSDTSYADSSRAACKYLVPHAGGNTFEFEFNPDEATSEQTEKAMELCVKELDNLPFCKTEFIRESACNYAIDNGTLSLDEFKAAVAKCKDDACEMKALELYPCNDEEALADKCWNDLWDNRESDAEVLDDYIENYREKYADL